MRIVNEKYLSLIWSWDKSEREGLERRFQTNLERLVYAIQERLEAGTPPAPEDMKELGGELQDAGEILRQGSENCLAAARSIYAAAAGDDRKRAERMQRIEKIESLVGKHVKLTQASVPEIADRPMILHEVNGIKAILRDGDNYWEALVDFLAPCEEDKTE